MTRVRFRLPKGSAACYRYLDLLHDALVNGWTEAGAPSEAIVGQEATAWNFAALGWHRKENNMVHTLVVSTPNAEISHYLLKMRPESIRKLRPSTGEAVDFSQAEVLLEHSPVLPGQGSLEFLMLSPLVIREKKNRNRWHTDLNLVDLSSAVNARLSRLSGRHVELSVRPDPLYLRANPKHSVLTPIKRYTDGKLGYVLGMSAPLAISGSDQDLELAWHAGIGEKTRNGFGCLGLLEQGVGR